MKSTSRIEERVTIKTTLVNRVNDSTRIRDTAGYVSESKICYPDTDNIESDSEENKVSAKRRAKNHLA
jgi:hypothetical protein